MGATAALGVELARPMRQVRAVVPTTIPHRELDLGYGCLAVTSIKSPTANTGLATASFPGYPYGAEVGGWNALQLQCRDEHMTVLRPGDRKVVMVLDRSTIFSVWLAQPNLCISHGLKNQQKTLFRNDRYCSIRAACFRAAHLLIVTALLSLPLVPISVLAQDLDSRGGGPNGNWVNVSEIFIRQIGADKIDPVFLCNCQGLIVTPDGELVMQTANKGICISKDQGANWSVVGDNPIKGRCETGFGFSLAYPYDGRMAFFCYDGTGGFSGGISLDHARTWRSFAQILRGVEFADVDWNAPNPQTILGMTHEPYRTVLSADGGKSWRKLHQDDEAGELDSYQSCRLGVISDQTLARYDSKQSGIELSTNAGQTWTRVADDRIIGRRPVHYGKNIYWNTAKGVIVSSDGEHWTLTGPGAEDACYGPFFGATEREFVVVTSRAFLKTNNGGKAWQKLADLYKAPDLFHGNPMYCYFGWDARHNLLYSSGLGASVYQLGFATK